VHRAESAAAASALSATHARHAVAVVRGAFVRIAQHLIGFGDELELLLGRFVAVVAVGVALHGELAVGLLDVGFARVFLDAEDDVEILLHAIRAAPHETRCVVDERGDLVVRHARRPHHADDAVSGPKR